MVAAAAVVLVVAMPTKEWNQSDHFYLVMLR